MEEKPGVSFLYLASDAPGEYRHLPPHDLVELIKSGLTRASYEMRRKTGEQFRAFLGVNLQAPFSVRATLRCSLAGQEPFDLTPRHHEIAQYLLDVRGRIGMDPSYLFTNHHAGLAVRVAESLGMEVAREPLDISLYPGKSVYLVHPAPGKSA